MAKRYYTTELFDDAWFMDLPNKYKLFWLFLLAKCDHAGIWQVNWKVAQFYVGDNLEPSEVKRILSERIVEIDNGKYWFIPKFITFQYGNEIRESNTVHKKFIDYNKKYNLLQYIEKTKIIEAPSKPLQSPFKGDKDKDKDKAKDRVKSLKIEEREELFKSELKNHKDKYSREMLSAFFNYWKEPNRSKTKMRFELEGTWSTPGRLSTWYRRETK